MAFHPRDRGRRSGQPLTRRDFLRSSAAAGLVLPALPALLAACGGDGSEPSAAVDIQRGTPERPVTQPLFDDNPMVASGLEPEAGPLRLYNWAEYINPASLRRAERALGVDIEVTTFYNLETSIQQLVSGEVSYDVWFPTAEYMGRAVAGKLIQPLNHSYLPNLQRYVWPLLADPYYDRGSRYSVPYVLYQTGIGWRTDMVDSADIEGQDNPWDVLWNTAYKGITGIYDDIKEALPMAMFRAGIADPYHASEAEISAAADSLAELTELMDIRYTIDGAYAGIPEGRFGLHQAWAGDMVNSQYYFPRGEDTTVVRYLWPGNAEGSTVNGIISNDTMTVLRNAEHPVLAHLFLNWLLAEENALKNFEWLGYQPPQVGLDPDALIDDGWVPEWLASAIIRESDFTAPRGTVPVELDPETERLWTDAWTRVQSSG